MFFLWNDAAEMVGHRTPAGLENGNFRSSQSLGSEHPVTQVATTYRESLAVLTTSE